uniref:Uncharacterized protein n=1 Tax=Arundo donax TaxID=35708 RepID=A0A0A9HEN8_ARUDO
MLWYPDCSGNSLCITGNKDLIISYCKADPNDSSSDDNDCSINISKILTVKCFAKIKAGDLCKQKNASKFQNTPSEALRNITALYYDEKREEIYTGNAQGLVHVWSS